MRRTLKSLAQLFQISSKSSGNCLICFNHVRLRKVSWTCYLQTFFSNYRICLLRYFWKLFNWRKSKNPAMSCLQISLNQPLLRMCLSWHGPFKIKNDCLAVKRSSRVIIFCWSKETSKIGEREKTPYLTSARDTSGKTDQGKIWLPRLPICELTSAEITTYRVRKDTKDTLS